MVRTTRGNQVHVMAVYQTAADQTADLEADGPLLNYLCPRCRCHLNSRLLQLVKPVLCEPGIIPTHLLLHLLCWFPTRTSPEDQGYESVLSQTVGPAALDLDAQCSITARRGAGIWPGSARVEDIFIWFTLRHSCFTVLKTQALSGLADHV